MEAMDDSWDWDMQKPSRAVIASRGEDGAVLSYVGGHLALEIGEMGMKWADLEFGGELVPDGISIWEGMVRYDREGEPVETRGTFRAPTDEEWAAIRAGACPWDAKQWQKPATGLRELLSLPELLK
jgi:hypothetical protein